MLLDCYRNVQLSFGQIHARHFAGRARPTVANRIGTLRRRGLLVVHRLGAVIYQGGRVAVGAVYHVTKRGMQLLQALYPQVTFRERPALVNNASLIHDLILTEVLTALASRSPSNRITHGRLLDVPEGQRRRMPDAVMEAPDGGGQIAIELELTAKSERRYRSIVFQYRTDPKYQTVLYVVAGRAIEAKVRRIIAGRRMIPGLPVPDAGKFEFLTLGSLLDRASVASIAHQTLT